MMESENIGNKNVSNDKIEFAKLLWDEYKYRHELCWNLLIKITVVVTTLSIIPYINHELIESTAYLVIFTPLIGILLCIFGGYRLYRELVLLDKIRDAHREFQNAFYPLKPVHKLGDSQFTINVNIYMSMLTILAVVNSVILLFTYLCENIT